RFNEPMLGTWVIETRGDNDAVLATDDLLAGHRDHWLVREVIGYLGRTFKRLDLTSRTIVALVEPGSCFAGTLAELVLAADRSFMLDGQWEDDERPPATLVLNESNLSWYPMSNGLTRLATRHYGRPEDLAAVEKR